MFQTIIQPTSFPLTPPQNPSQHCDRNPIGGDYPGLGTEHRLFGTKKVSETPTIILVDDTTPTIILVHDPQSQMAELRELVRELRLSPLPPVWDEESEPHSHHHSR